MPAATPSKGVLDLRDLVDEIKDSGLDDDTIDELVLIIGEITQRIIAVRRILERRREAVA